MSIRKNIVDGEIVIDYEEMSESGDKREEDDKYNENVWFPWLFL